jgi:hypothetical protein
MVCEITARLELKLAAQWVDEPTSYSTISTKPILYESKMRLTADIVILLEPVYETWLAVVL